MFHHYTSSEGLTEANLKTALYNTIKGHTEYPYTSDNTDVWDILKETDKDTINPDNVILFYTGWTVDAAQEYNSEAGWNREHVWAKSRGDFGTTMGPGTDVHHLRPTAISVNSARNNRWFDNCTEQYIDGDGATDSYTSSTSWVWQDEKGIFHPTPPDYHSLYYKIQVVRNSPIYYTCFPFLWHNFWQKLKL